MKIKRYVAPTMREVLAQVREEQGPDAVIISNRRAEGGGVELITAVDYDDALMDQALRAVNATPNGGDAFDNAPAAASYRPEYAAEREPVRYEPPAPEAPRMVWSQDPSLVAMRREVESLRDLLEQQMAALSWNDRMRREPVQARVLLELSRVGIAPDAARLLVNNLKIVTRDAEPGRLAMALLMKHVAVSDESQLARDRVVTVVGGTGVGKTTTIVKLAARHARKHGPSSVGFVSVAEDRIGSRDELVSFSRLLDAPLLRVESSRGLNAAIEQMRDRSLVLKGCSARGRLLLTLAANTDQDAQEELTRALLPLKPHGVMLTKTDEAAAFGGALSVLIRHALPLTYLSTGQGMVEDLHSAASRRVWLIKQSYALAKREAPVIPVDDNYMAEHFGRQAKHA